MADRSLQFETAAMKEFKEWIKTDRKTALRIIEICEHTTKDPFRGIGKPEPLKHDRQGFGSRRITKEHRVVYKVTSNSIIVVSCKGHY